MATTQDYVEFVCEQVQHTGEVRYRKMFGEYMVYINDKPLLLVCDNTVFVKPVEAIWELLGDAECVSPYDGAKPYYVLDIEDVFLAEQVIAILEPITPLPKPRKKRVKAVD